MRKQIRMPIYIRKFILLTLITTSFVIILSFILLRNSNMSQDIVKSVLPKFTIKPKDIVLNENNRTEPKIKVYITKQDKIIEMNLEEYVRGVVAAEMPVEFEIEALKAQAVAARTFALAHMEEYGGQKYKSSAEANVCDTVECQVFMNKEDRYKTWPVSKRDEYWNKISKAVNKTSGEVLTYSGKIIEEPLFFAVSSGRTEDVLDVFKDEKPYLKSVESPGEDIAPKYKSEVKIGYSEFIRKINDNYKNSNVNLLNVKNQIEIKSRNESGSVKEIRLGKITISGVKFRSIMGLNSTNFKIKFNTSNVEIDCTGYGHGVGMSQWGASVMAKKGKSFAEILQHYYSGTEITKIYKNN